MLSRFGKCNWRDLYRLPVAFFLALLVLRNYSLRERCLLPDEWYWADELLLSWGYAVSSNAELKRWVRGSEEHDDRNNR